MSEHEKNAAPLHHSLKDDEIHYGLRWLLYDGMCSQVMTVFITGAFLVAFALLLGASNKVIGFIAAIGPLSQVLQIPAIYLIHWLRERKKLTVVCAVIGRSLWLLIAILPWLMPKSLQIPLLMLALLIYFGLGAITGCAFNSWMRDLVPEHMMGGFFAKRMSFSTAMAALFSLLAGGAIDVYSKHFSDATGIYSILFVVGALTGLLGAYVLSKVPEPTLPQQPAQRILSILAEPFQNRNYRNLIFFLGAWNFALTFASPFFAVYMLKRLGLSMTWIIALGVLSQIFNVLFFRIWGRLSDRISNKAVLGLSGSLFVFSVLIWPFLTLPERHFLTLPMLVAFHILSGIALAGIALCSSNLALKSAPYGRATAFLAVNALVSGAAATIAPIVAGFAADWFENKELCFMLTWGAIEAVPKSIKLPAINLRGLDFLFVTSFFLGLYALHRLLAVQEKGWVKENIIAAELYAEVRRLAQNVSNIRGIRQLTHFPYALLERLNTRNHKHLDEDD